MIYAFGEEGYDFNEPKGLDKAYGLEWDEDKNGIPCNFKQVTDEDISGQQFKV